MPARNQILVFAKLPRAGRVKTRLVGTLSAQEAAALHLACLRDTLRMVETFGGAEPRLLLAADSRNAQRFARRLGLGQNWQVRTQGRGTLGARLARAFRSGFLDGAERIIAVGSDSPWMGARRLRAAFRALTDADVVLGPAADGGYYLVGASRFLPELFEEIPWGSGHVLAATLRALRGCGASWRLLPRDFDLDRPADLRRAERWLRIRPKCCPALREWFAERRGARTALR
ncbi:MAG: TIGR04282 family arsenosugar biosynthesis glycosyltransferase [Firmicutes bacterium]|nr:TIGR04282 family arsenosugar biosynthesis glycosyltransferase [Bacillota bacterium]